MTKHPKSRKIRPRTVKFIFLNIVYPFPAEPDNLFEFTATKIQAGVFKQDVLRQ